LYHDFEWDTIVLPWYVCGSGFTPSPLG